MAFGRRPLLSLALLCLTLGTARGSPQTAATDKPPGSKQNTAELLQRIEFNVGSSELDGRAKGQLDELATRIPAPDADRRRVQILAFASGDKDLVSANRRLSLQRALVVRAYLLERSVAPDRIDVRALGTIVMGDGPPDRVDVYLGTVNVPMPPRNKPK